MRKQLLLFGCSLLFYRLAITQPLNDVAGKAFVITRMAEKFHVQPRSLDDTFSLNVFNSFLNHLDPRSVLFTQQDLKELDKFKYQIDDDIKNRQTNFLTVVINISKMRLGALDTMMNSITQKPFNFSLPEKITKIELKSAPANENQQRNKIYKLLKAFMLDRILDNDKINSPDVSGRQKYLDSFQKVSLINVRSSFKNSVLKPFESANGIEDAINTGYCEAIASVYDPHSGFFLLTEKENFESELGKQKMIFGFRFGEDENGIRIENVKAGSPAFKSGQINKGDKIISIQWGNQNPIDVSQSGYRQLSEVLDLSNHDKATIRIRKPDGSERLVVLYKEAEDENNDENKVKSFLLKGEKTIGFISLPAFYQDWENRNSGVNGCANDVAKEILKLKKENIDGLVLDLRYNGGGSMDEAIDLIGLFIDAGPVAQYKSRDGQVFTLKDNNRGTMYDGPLMIMVNGFSASASEIVAGTLQDYHRAVIIGSVTYGKATAQVIMPMDTTIGTNSDLDKVITDSYLKLTVSELYRVTGQTAQGNGIRPDILLRGISDMELESENREPFTLVSSPIQPCKYFKSLTPVQNLNELQSLANRKMDSSRFFRILKKYNDETSNEIESGEVNLNLEYALKHSLQDVVSFDPGLKESADSITTFKVENNQFEKQRIDGNEPLKEINDQWVNLLLNDPYLKIAFAVISLMK